MSTADEIESMISDCEARDSKLSEWELQFVDDMSVRIGRGESLTAAQDKKLEEIWERITQ